MTPLFTPGRYEYESRKDTGNVRVLKKYMQLLLLTVRPSPSVFPSQHTEWYHPFRHRSETKMEYDIPQELLRRHPHAPQIRQVQLQKQRYLPGGRLQILDGLTCLDFVSCSKVHFRVMGEESLVLSLSLRSRVKSL